MTRVIHILIVCTIVAVGAAWMQRRSIAPADEGLATAASKCRVVTRYALDGMMGMGVTRKPVSAKYERFPVGSDKDATLWRYRFASTLPGLDGELYALVDSRGAMVNLYRASTTPPARLNEIKSAVLTTQLRQSPDGKPGSYSAEENDPKGIVAVTYEATPETVTKTRHAFSRYWMPSGQVELVQSRTTFHLRQDGTPTEITFAEDARYRASGSLATMMETTVTTTHHMTEARESCAMLQPPAGAVHDLALVELPFLPQQDPAADAAERDKVIAGRDLATLAMGLHSTDPAVRSEAMTALYLYLGAHPEKLSDLRAEIDRHVADADYAQALIGVMGMLPSEAGQRALLDLMKAYEKNPAVLIAAMRTHHLTPTPADENVKYLLARYADKSAPQEVREAAALAAGSASRTLAGSPNAAEARDSLRESLAKTQVPEEKQYLTAAIGNAGDSGALPQLREMAWGKDSALATRATEALRFVPGEDADHELMRLLARRDDPGIQDSAAFALGHRSLSDKMVQTIAADYDGHESPIKLKVLDLLGQDGNRNLGASQALFKKAANSGDEREKAKAHEIMERDATASPSEGGGAG